MNNINVQTFLIDGMKRYQDTPAITSLDTNETISYRQLMLKIEDAASYLFNLGVRRGTKVLVAIPNSIEFVCFSLGAAMCGGTTISLGEKVIGRGVDFILRDSEPTVAVVSTGDHVQPVHQYLMETDNVIAVGVEGFDAKFPEGFKIFDWNGITRVEDFPQTHPDDLAGLFYTGGTTGLPKAVMHSRQSLGMALLANCLENPFDDQDRVLFTPPLQNAAGMLFYRSLVAGAHTFISRHFDAEEYLNTIEKLRITTIFVVPTMIYRLVDQGKKKKYDLNSLRTITYGTAPMEFKYLKEAIEMFGPVLKQHYGQTECPLLVSRLTKSDHLWAYHNNPDILRSCGKPAILTQFRIVDDNNNDVPPFERGEIIVKAPYTALGYYKRPELTKDLFTDGWLHTGDIGQMDEFGFIHIVDRKKDMIITGGHNVYSKEVEIVINQHPAVSLSACIGVPHSDWGEAVIAFVVLKEGAACTEKDLIDFCKMHTAKYMVPKQIIIKDSLPLTTIGKIDKKELKKPFWEGKTRQVN